MENVEAIKSILADYVHEHDEREHAKCLCSLCAKTRPMVEGVDPNSGFVPFTIFQRTGE